MPYLDAIQNYQAFMPQEDTLAPYLKARAYGQQSRLKLMQDYSAEEKRKADEEEKRLRLKREEDAQRASVAGRLREAAGAPVPGTMNPPTPQESRLGVIGALPNLYETGGTEGFNLGKGYLDMMKPQYEGDWQRPQSEQDAIIGFRKRMYPEAFDMWHGRGGAGGGTDNRPRVRAFEFKALIEKDYIIKSLRERQAQAQSAYQRAAAEKSPYAPRYLEDYYNLENQVKVRQGELVKDYQVVDDIPDESQGGVSTQPGSFDPTSLTPEDIAALQAAFGQ